MFDQWSLRMRPSSNAHLTRGQRRGGDLFDVLRGVADAEGLVLPRRAGLPGWPAVKRAFSTSDQMRISTTGHMAFDRSNGF